MKNLVISFLNCIRSSNLEMKAKFTVIASMVLLTIVVGLTAPTATAENSTTVTPINDEISIQKTIIPMDIPEDNTFPWGSVRGEASTFAEKYPVIIQIYKGEDPVHFAQVDVKGDGSFEYKFRIRNVDAHTGEVVKIFEGHYDVSIFKVIPNPNEKA